MAAVNGLQLQIGQHVRHGKALVQHFEWYGIVIDIHVRPQKYLASDLEHYVKVEWSDGRCSDMPAYNPFIEPISQEDYLMALLANGS